MKQRDLAILLGSAFLLTVLWVIFSVYHNYTSTTISDTQTVQIIPIQSTFDQSAVDKIKSRSRVNPLYDQEIKDKTTELTPTKAPAQNQSLLNSGLGNEGIATDSSNTSAAPTEAP